MHFDEAKAVQAKIEAEVKATGATLKAFPKEGPWQLTPDHVRASIEYKVAKARYDAAFSTLRSFNAIFVKKFAKELRAERRAREEQRT